MKTWMLALAVLAVVGMTGLADAGGKGSKKGGMRGKIQSVSAGVMTLTTHHHGKKNSNLATTTTQPSSLTIKFNTTVTIDGVEGKLDASAIGKYATVVGSTNADASVTATQITVTTKKASHKKAAA